MLDITHEALIRQWTRLLGWADDEAQLAETYRFLERNAELWKQGHMALWGTPNLEMALDWRERARPTAAWAARYGGDFGLAIEFLDASAAARAAYEKEQQTQRRRRDRRLKTVAAASSAVALLSVSMIAGVYWMFFMEHVDYYRGFGKRFGEPFGIGPLNAEQVAHRAPSLRFVQKGFSWSLWRKTGNLHPTIRIEAVDAKGRCTANNNIGTYLSEQSDYSPLHECRYEFIRAADDEIVGERAYAKDASLRWGYHYSTPENDANGQIGYYLGPNGFFSQFPNSLAEVVQFTYSPTGNEIRREYFDHGGHRQPGKDHAYGQEIEYDADGRPTMQTSIDASGRPMNDTAGNATMRVEYDGAGNQAREWALDKGGRPVQVKQGFYEFDAAYDAYGNPVSQAFFDEAGRPSLNKDGVHEIRWAYNDEGDIREIAYFNESGHPMLSRYGYHRIDILEFGPDGRWRRWAYYGTNGDKATDTSGAHEYVATYDSKGFEIRLQPLDEQDRPVRAGCFDQRMAFDANGFEISEACFDSNGQPALSDDGTHRKAFGSDSRGTSPSGLISDATGYRQLAARDTIAGPRPTARSARRLRRPISARPDSRSVARTAIIGAR